MERDQVRGTRQGGSPCVWHGGFLAADMSLSVPIIAEAGLAAWGGAGIN